MLLTTFILVNQVFFHKFGTVLLFLAPNAETDGQCVCEVCQIRVALCQGQTTTWPKEREPHTPVLSLALVTVFGAGDKSTVILRNDVRLGLSIGNALQRHHQEHS